MNQRDLHVKDNRKLIADRRKNGVSYGEKRKSG